MQLQYTARVLPLSVLGLLSIQLTPTSAAAGTLDVSSLGVHVSKSHTNGTPDFKPYRVEIYLSGSDIASAHVVDPQQVTIPLVYVPGDDEWVYELALLADFAEVKANFKNGSYQLHVTETSGLTKSGTFDVVLGVEPHQGYGQLAMPVDGAIDVPIHTTIHWTCENPPCGDFGWFMEVYPLGIAPGPAYEATIFDPLVSSWIPGCLAGDTDHELWLSSGSLLTGGVQFLSLTGNDSYEYRPDFEVTNTMHFRTAPPQTTSSSAVRLGLPPNPMAFFDGPDGGPTIGEAWMPFVNHSTFLPAAAVDLLAVSATPANVPVAEGTLLVGLTPKPLFQYRPAGQPFSVAVPEVCSLVGAPLWSQVLSIEPSGVARLTNGLDLRIGTHD